MVLYRVAAFLLKPVFYFLFRISARGRENIPDGAAIVCCNHTSLLDPVVLGLVFGYKYPVRFMAKKELFQIKFFGGLIRSLGAFPVNRESADLATIRTSISILKAGEKLMMFPEGKRVFEEDETRENVKMGVGLIAAKAKVPIIPVYISGNKRLFRRTWVSIGEAMVPDYENAKGNEAYMGIALSVFDRILELGQHCKK